MIIISSEIKTLFYRTQENKKGSGTGAFFPWSHDTNPKAILNDMGPRYGGL